MALGSTQPLVKMSTRNISWGWRGPVREADNLTTFMCRMSWKSGSLNLLEPSGPQRACYGTDLPFFSSSSSSSNSSGGAVGVGNGTVLQCMYTYFDYRITLILCWERKCLPSSPSYRDGRSGISSSHLRSVGVLYQPLLCVFYRVWALERHLNLLGHTVYIPWCTVCLLEA